MSTPGRKIISNNKKAYHNYNISEKYVAGLVLTGTEIKSIRTGGLSLKDSFAKIDKGEMFLHNCHINPYDKGNRYNQEPERVRKLLLNKKEIMKIVGKLKQDSYTLVALGVFLQNGWAKVELGLGKGKKLYDKRETLKNKDIQRSLARSVHWVKTNHALLP